MLCLFKWKRHLNIRGNKTCMLVLALLLTINTVDHVKSTLKVYSLGLNPFESYWLSKMSCTVGSIVVPQQESFGFKRKENESLCMAFAFSLCPSFLGILALQLSKNKSGGQSVFSPSILLKPNAVWKNIYIIFHSVWHEELKCSLY